jgi:uncharacterized protein
MKIAGLSIALALLSLTSCGQSKGKANKEIAKSNPENTLLWKISGNGLEKPSYLFGTIHIICKDDAVLSDNLKAAIKSSDAVYLELDMDNMFEMLGAMTKMKMRGDTTLGDLLSAEEMKRVEAYFEKENSMLPFSMLKTYKPFLAASMLTKNAVPCEGAMAMEQVIMEEAKLQKKDINGMETMAYQLSIFDTIPYKLQAQQLLQYIDTAKADSDDKMMEELMENYKKQDLVKLEKMMNESDMGIANFTDLLLYNRNRNWVKKMKTLLPGKTFVIAVGAGHLPGENGVISLLRKEGYTVTPMENKMVKKVVI